MLVLFDFFEDNSDHDEFANNQWK